MEEASEDAKSKRKMHPLQLGVDIISEMNNDDWLVFDGGNTHFWNEIAVNISGWRGKKLGGIMHPGNYSLLGVGISFGVSAKAAQGLCHSTRISHLPVMLAHALSRGGTFSP